LTGKGGYGRVFFALPKTKALKILPENTHQVAIKVMPHSNAPERLRNFREIGHLHKFSAHPNIVRYHWSLLVDRRAGPQIWVITEFMQGGTLMEAAQKHPFEEKDVAYVAREMLKGLDYLHSMSYAHRDLKSANVMMSVEGDIKLIDFGLCAHIGKNKKGLNKERGKMCGSPFWMAPEMIKGKKYGVAVDIWSLAVCLLEMKYQVPPNYSSRIYAMFTAATEGINLNPKHKHSPDFADFFKKCLSIDPEMRPSAGELLKHPFLDRASKREDMQVILKQVFLLDSMAAAGIA